MPNTRVLLCLLFIFLVHGSFDWLVNQPQNAGIDVPSGKLTSLSFAPFREGFSPLEEIFPLPEHIDEDLRLLADKTHSIRTYSSLGGLESTPEMARKYGLKMLQGAWIGFLDVDNRKEIAALIKSANAHPDVVQRVIVGNEVLLRGEMDVNRLISYIREVKKAVKQPVSYADVWSMYMKHPQLFNEVDFITIHILPYWEDEPISVDNASQHLEKIVKQVEDEARGVAPGKPILIGESGWPSAGRQRGMAIPGVVNEAKFIRGMIQVANRHNFDYNIVEAFNQPWKSELEGVVGANWGLFSVDRQPVFPLTGPVVEKPNWPVLFAVSSLICLLIVAFFAKQLGSMSLIRLVAFLTLAQVFSACWVMMGDFLWYTSYNLWQRLYTVAMLAANAGIAWLLLHRYYGMLCNHSEALPLASRLRTGYLLFIGLALFKTFALAINGRYLSFPVEQFLIPALGILGLIVCRWLNSRKLNTQLLMLDGLVGGSVHGRYDRLVGYLLILGIAGLVVGETAAFMDGRDFILAHPGFSEGLPFALGYTLHNQQLLNWLVCLLVLSLPFWSRSSNATQSA